MLCCFQFEFSLSDSDSSNYGLTTQRIDENLISIEKASTALFSLKFYAIHIFSFLFSILPIMPHSFSSHFSTSSHSLYHLVVGPLSYSLSFEQQHQSPLRPPKSHSCRMPQSISSNKKNSISKKKKKIHFFVSLSHSFTHSHISHIFHSNISSTIPRKIYMPMILQQQKQHQ